MFNEHKRNNMTAIQLVPISQHGPPLSSGEKQCGKKYAANKEHSVFWAMQMIASLNQNLQRLQNLAMYFLVPNLIGSSTAANARGAGSSLPLEMPR
jgi:hypothetical protein